MVGPEGLEKLFKNNDLVLPLFLKNTKSYQIVKNGVPTLQIDFGEFYGVAKEGIDAFAVV